MAWLFHEQGREIFIFHDDNFFVPNKKESLARIRALGAALRARRVGRIATVVKARPTDVTPQIFAAMRDELGCVRVFLGVESAAAQGLKTLNRKVSTRRNREAMAILRQLGLYVCYNMLVFDPDATIDSLLTNFEFIVEHGHYPTNFGRVELYAGTPLLERMQRERRATGDYLRWDYRMATPEVQRVFELAMRCFYPRNFSDGALANRLQSTHFDVHIAHHFHPARAHRDWYRAAEDLSRALSEDSAAGIRAIVQQVADAPPSADDAFVEELSARMRERERVLSAAASELEQGVRDVVGAGCQHGRPRQTAASGSPPTTAWAKAG